MVDGYQAELDERESLALELTDDLIGLPGQLSADTLSRLSKQFSAAEIVELSLSVGLFLGMSKVLITLGLEPEEMEVTVLPTPGSDGGSATDNPPHQE